jgi:hypothetical protein
LYGQGSNGYGGSIGQGGGGGSNGSAGKNSDFGGGGLYGGGGGKDANSGLASGGGALVWANNISVTPGSLITIVVGNGGYRYYQDPNGSGAPGAVRIIWGPGRSFPYNAS